MKLIIVSGLSGAGKTVALKQYEDLGYYCIDNIPLALMGPMATRIFKRVQGRYEHLAVGVDARESAEQIQNFPRYVERLRKRGAEVRVLFLTAQESVLIKRYSETRRKHPLSDEHTPLREALLREIELLEPIASVADATIDTSYLNLHELRERIQGEIPGGGRGKLAITLMSFGFKHGAPTDADFVFDVRCLPNPHWEKQLRQSDGRDAACAAWLEPQAEVRRMFNDLAAFLESWLPEYRKQDRAYLTVAIGCTGGRHRSVYLVERLAERLRAQFSPLIIKHRELVS